MSKAKQITLCAVLTALALALSYAERFIPLQALIPLPGVKLGLANIVTLVALYRIKPRHTWMILIARCILSALFGGGITGLMFSLWGGSLALGAMLVAKKAPWLSVYGVSIAGATAHSIGQIVAAMALMSSVYIAAYLPYLLLVSIFTGLLTGSACAGVVRLIPSSYI